MIKSQPYIIAVFFLLTLLASAQDGPNSAAVALEPIQFETFDDAVEKSRDEQKPIVLVFSAKWCSWCKTMQAGPMRSPEVLALAPNYVWAKSDLDAEPFLAAAYQVRSVPAIRVINGKGQTLEAKSGYMTAYQLKDLLETYKDGFNAIGQEASNILHSTKLYDRLNDYKEGEADKTVFSEAVAWLSRPHPPMKRAIMEALLNHKEKLWPILVADMASTNLAIRAAAAELLKQSSKLSFTYDPFANEVARASQLDVVKGQVNDVLEKQFYPDMR